MRITVLTENTTCREDLICEHGLSLYIETGDVHILFDAGQTDAFAKNAEALGIDLRRADIAVLSHGHYDHGGGLGTFLEINPSAPVYVSREAFGAHYSGTAKYIGLDPALAGHPRLSCADSGLTLAPGITLHPGTALPHPDSSYGLTLLEQGRHIPDPFRHEQYLQITESGTKILFSGCSHKGILSIAAHFRPDVLVGGFHFTKLTPEQDAPFLNWAAESLLKLPTRYFTGHCTGAAPFAYLKERMGQRLQPLSTGTVIEL